MIMHGYGSQGKWILFPNSPQGLVYKATCLNLSAYALIKWLHLCKTQWSPELERSRQMLITSMFFVLLGVAFIATKLF